MANKLLIVTIILPLIAFLIYYRLEKAGIFRPELRHYEHPTYPRCWKMDLKGVDDFSINPKGRFVFLSTLNKRQYLVEGIEDPSAGIYAFNLTAKPEGNIVEKINLVNFPPNLKLHPHGISFFETKRNEQFLFVIDHQKDGEYVQIFEYKKSQLYWKRNVTSPLFTSLNGIVGISNTSFYVTNDHQFGSPLLFAEDLLGLCLGSVLHYDGQQVSTAISNLCVPNGIDINPDLTTLYLTQSQIGTVTIYKRDKKNSTLTELKKIELDFGVDNIKVQKNQLTVGGHRNVIDMYSYIFFKNPCPSTVVRLTLDKDLDPAIERMYSDDGKLGSFTTGAIISLGRVLIGSGMDDYLTVCENPEVIPAKGKLSMKEMARLEKEIMKAEKLSQAEAETDF